MVFIIKGVLLFPFHVVKSIIRNIAYGKLNKKLTKKGEDPVKY